MKRLSIQEKEKIVELYRSGLNCIQIKDKMKLRGHQQVLNVLKKLPDYIPYRNGRGINRKYSLIEDYFEDINTEEKAYILGFICADGHLDLKSGQLEILVQQQDIDILEKIRKALGSDAPIRKFTRKSSFLYGKREFLQCKIGFCSKKLIKTLTNKGLCNRKSENLNSSIFNFIPNNLKRHFLRGHFDGDGNIVWAKRYNSGIKYGVSACGNLEFLENTYGKEWPTKNTYYFFKKSKQTYLYRISGKERTTQFLFYLYHDSKIYLDRKFNIFELACAHLKPIELLETH